MSADTLSEQLADSVAAIAPSVVQVIGRRRPASGVVHGQNVVVTTARALGGDDGLRVRTPDGRALEADLAGWDPTSGLAVLRVGDLNAPSASVAPALPRVGHLALAVARSFSNVVTASAGIVSIIGGPLPTGRGRAIDQVIRTTAPMHDGFAGGAFVDTAGRLVGVATAASIRGLGVIIPTAIAWKTAATLLEHGQMRRGYLGLAGQPAKLGERQRGPDGREYGLLIVGVNPASPADAAGLIVGDVLVAFDGQPVQSPEDLLELLVGERVGRRVTVKILRAGEPKEVTAEVAERR